WPRRLRRASMRRVPESRGARLQSRRVACSAALPGPLQATRNLAGLCRPRARYDRRRDLSALARGGAMSHEHHAHGPGGAHEHLPDAEERIGYYQTMEIAVRELLIEKGIITPADVRMAVEAMDARTPAQGARVVAR